MLDELIILGIGYVLGRYFHEDIRYIGRRIKETFTRKY